MALKNPHEAIRPDFNAREHQSARQQLIADGLNEDQATHMLKSLWTLKNNANKAHCNERQEQIQEMCQQEEEEKQQHLQVLQDEEEAACLEERKKNKNKYAPFARGKVPSEPTILPAPYATRKIKAGDYCELHYFTNKGLDNANKSAQIAEPDVLVMLPSADGIHSWVPADAVKDPKASPVMKDENLTWEEFNEAVACIINYMRTHDWLVERVNMLIQFWSALQQHHWCHASDPLKQCVLLLYQSQQHRRWHLSIGTGLTWSLEEINQDLLLEA